MAISRAEFVYPVNSTTQYITGSGLTRDVRLLADSQPGADEINNIVTLLHTDDNVERVFDPATTNSTGAQNSQALVGNGFGWAYRLTNDMTPGDDTNCNILLAAGDLQLQYRVNCTRSGGTYLGTEANNAFVVAIRCGLIDYDPVAGTGSLIVGGTNNLTWTNAGLSADLGTQKLGGFTMTIPAGGYEVPQGHILLLQISVRSGLLPNPSLGGTGTFSFTLYTDNSSTYLRHHVNLGLKQLCRLSNDNVGSGVPTQSPLQITQPRSATGDGVPTYTRAAIIAKAFSLVGDGVPTETQATTYSRIFSLTGDGVPTESRAVVAAKSFSLTGDGVTSQNFHAGITRDAVGDGVPTYTRVVVAAKAFSLVADGTATGNMAITQPRSATGDGVPTMTRAVVAAKAFSLIGDGVVTQSQPRQIQMKSDTRNNTADGVPTYTRAVVAAKSFSLVGDGVPTESRAVLAARTFTLLGDGVATETELISQPRSAIGDGVVTYTRALVAAKAFTLLVDGLIDNDTLTVLVPRTATGDGVVTELHPVTAARTFSLEADGLITGTITIPIDELPDGEEVVIRPRKVFIFDD